MNDIMKNENIHQANPFPSCLKRTMQEKGIKHRELEEKTGLGSGAISKMLSSGNATIQNVLALEDALGVERGSLLGASPPIKANGDDSILPQLSRMAVELMDIMNDFHLRALEGVITAEQFETILLGATGGMLEAAGECGVESKKAIG
jgi:transcriptional regulator with XRE-family HTH domain